MAPSTLDPREFDTVWDAGNYWPAGFGNFVWEDIDADGIQDPGEDGMEGVRVRLFNASGAEVASTVTDGDGEYEFLDLTPGTYHLEIDIPDGYSAAPQDRGPGQVDDDESDSDIDEDGVMEATLLQSNEVDLDWDAGLFQSASIGDLVWEDLDADGIQDSGEPGLAGVTVRLLDSSGTPVRSTVTGADGKFVFRDLVTGRYRIEVVIPTGYVASPRNKGSDDTADSDVNAEGLAPRTTLLPGEHDRSWDAGLVAG